MIHEVWAFGRKCPMALKGGNVLWDIAGNLDRLCPSRKNTLQLGNHLRSSNASQIQILRDKIETFLKMIAINFQSHKATQTYTHPLTSSAVCRETLAQLRRRHCCCQMDFIVHYLCFYLDISWVLRFQDFFHTHFWFKCWRVCTNVYGGNKLKGFFPPLL